MKKSSPLISIGLQWGALAGILIIVLLIAMFYIGRHPLMISPFMDFRILLLGVCIFFSLREFREGYQQGSLYFWQGMAGGFIMVVVAGTIASLLLLVFCSLESSFIPDYVKAMTAYLKTFPAEDIARIGKDVYERNLEQLPATNSKQIASLYFIQSLMIGFFVSIILSVILRKEPKPVNNGNN
ncbi:MAG TPA: DUF4199 domain-containing protein [Cyclobacteriaceae bacterium]|nr:DUF4199 domain-containing protein [Cyclobacteriaceae bacterium]